MISRKDLRRAKDQGNLVLRPNPSIPSYPPEGIKDSAFARLIWRSYELSWVVSKLEANYLRDIKFQGVPALGISQFRDYLPDTQYMLYSYASSQLDMVTKAIITWDNDTNLDAIDNVPNLQEQDPDGRGYRDMMFKHLDGGNEGMAGVFWNWLSDHAEGAAWLIADDLWRMGDFIEGEEPEDIERSFPDWDSREEKVVWGTTEDPNMETWAKVFMDQIISDYEDAIGGDYVITKIHDPNYDHLLGERSRHLKGLVIHVSHQSVHELSRVADWERETDYNLWFTVSFFARIWEIFNRINAYHSGVKVRDFLLEKLRETIEDNALDIEDVFSSLAEHAPEAKIPTLLSVFNETFSTPWDEFIEGSGIVLPEKNVSDEDLDNLWNEVQYEVEREMLDNYSDQLVDNNGDPDGFVDDAIKISPELEYIEGVDTYIGVRKAAEGLDITKTPQERIVAINHAMDVSHNNGSMGEYVADHTDMLYPRNWNALTRGTISPELERLVK